MLGHGGPLAVPTVLFTGLLGAVLPVAFRLTLGGLFAALLAGLTADGRWRPHWVGLALTILALLIISWCGIH